MLSIQIKVVSILIRDFIRNMGKYTLKSLSTTAEPFEMVVSHYLLFIKVDVLRGVV